MDADLILTILHHGLVVALRGSLAVELATVRRT
jgi:hypothetical protein